MTLFYSITAWLPLPAAILMQWTSHQVRKCLQQVVSKYVSTVNVYVLMAVAPLIYYIIQTDVVVNVYDLGKEWSVMWYSFISSIMSYNIGSTQSI